MWRFVSPVLFAMFCGCSSGPKAPALYDSPVFHSDSDGFRFLMPDEFKLSSRSELPSGRIEDDRVIVRYHRFGTAKAASFEVSRRDDWSVETLDSILQTPSHGVNQWADSGKREVLDLRGTPGYRRSFEGVLGKDKMTKEVVAFKRGDRGYLFVTTSRSGDESARNQFRRILEGLTWLE